MKELVAEPLVVVAGDGERVAVGGGVLVGVVFALDSPPQAMALASVKMRSAVAAMRLVAANVLMVIGFLLLVV